MLTVPPTKACLLCAIPAGWTYIYRSMPEGSYRVHSPGFPKIVCCRLVVVSSTSSGCLRRRVSSVQFKMVPMLSEKSIRAPPRLSEVSPTSPLKRLQCSSDSQRPSLVLSRKTVWRFLFQCLSPPGDRWCDVLGFVPAGVSQASQHFRSSEKQATCDVFEGGCRSLTHSSLGFTFHFSFFIAKSKNL